MAKLPFVVTPRLQPIIETIGNENIGTIQIERRGYLTAGEKNFMSSQFNSELVTRKTLSLCRKIATECKIGQEEAYEVLQQVLGVEGNSKHAQRVESKFAEEISDLSSSMVDINSRRSLIAAFCMVLYRVDPSVEFEDFLDLHPDLVSGLSSLYEEEEAKTIDRLVESLEKNEASNENTAENLEKK